MASAEIQYWKRDGLFYKSTIIYRQRGKIGKITRELDFISYHLIKWILGEQVLRDMASKMPKM